MPIPDEKVLGSNEEFTPPTEDPANPAVVPETPPAVVTPPPEVPIKQMTQKEYDELMESKKVSDAILYEIKKAQERPEPQYPQQNFQQPQQQTPQHRQPIVEEYSEEEKNFLETFPAAKQLMDQNKALTNNFQAVQKTIEDMKKADYQKSVGAYQKQIDNDVKKLKADYPDLKEEDIVYILNSATGQSMRNPNDEITVYGLGSKFASRIGISRAPGATQPTQQTNPNGGAIQTTTPQETEPQKVVFEQKPEAKTFEDYFDRGYKDK